MPIYRTCAGNTDGSLISLTERHGEHADVVRWLCTRANRVDLRGEPAAFLEDVHDSFHDRGGLTSLQARGVRRWMARAERHATAAREEAAAEDGNDELQAAIVEDTESFAEAVAGVVNDRLAAYEGLYDSVNRWTGEERTLGAMWQQAQWIPNGEYMVRYGTTFSYRIHTLQASSANSNLVGKRVVSVYQNDRWVTFAFVSITGHLSLWSRFADMTNEVFVETARQLLESFREVDRAVTVGLSWNHHYANRSYRITRETLACRCCNGNMQHDDAEERAEGVHDRDCSQNRVGINRWGSTATEGIASTQARRPRPTRTPAPVAGTITVTPIVRMSELGTGWEQ